MTHLRTTRPRLRASTLKAYLAAAAGTFTASGLRDPRFTDTEAAPGPALLPRFLRIFRDIERWENMASRQEPVTRAMAIWLLTSSAPLPLASPDRAVANWVALGLSAGFRISEYGQPSPKTAYLPHTPTLRGLPRAFIAEDFVFHSSSAGPALPPATRHLAQYVTIRWRVQKNGENGEAITFAAIPASSSHHLLCPVRNALDIVDRADQLRYPHGILGVHSQGYVRPPQISARLRAAASKAHGITDTDALARFSPHSIRVGACVLLHESGAAPLFIQKRLRWRSLAFQMYLRNTASLASSHASLLAAAQQTF